MDLVLDLVFFRVLIWHIVLGHARLTHHVLYEYETYHRCSLLRPSLSLSLSLSLFPPTLKLRRRNKSGVVQNF